MITIPSSAAKKPLDVSFTFGQLLAPDYHEGHDT